MRHRGLLGLCVKTRKPLTAETLRAGAGMMLSEETDLVGGLRVLRLLWGRCWMHALSQRWLGRFRAPSAGSNGCVRYLRYLPTLPTHLTRSSTSLPGACKQLILLRSTQNVASVNL